MLRCGFPGRLAQLDTNVQKRILLSTAIYSPASLRQKAAETYHYYGHVKSFAEAVAELRWTPVASHGCLNEVTDVTFQLCQEDVFDALAIWRVDLVRVTLFGTQVLHFARNGGATPTHKMLTLDMMQVRQTVAGHLCFK